MAHGFLPVCIVFSNRCSIEAAENGLPRENKKQRASAPHADNRCAEPMITWPQSALTASFGRGLEPAEMVP
jgi:hypothetical protein